MSTTSPCCWCDPLPCRQALNRSQSQSKLRCSPCIGKKLATDPGILLSFLPSEKPQKRRKRSHTNVSNTLVARPLTPPAQTPQRSFQQASAGVLLSSANRLICLKYAEGAPIRQGESPFQSGFKSHSHKRFTFVFTGESGYTLAFANRIAHSGSQGETGAFRAGVVSLPSDRFARFRNHAWPGVRTALPLLGLGRVCSRRAQRACGTATRSCASLFRGVAAPLGCVIPLFFSLTTLMSFTVLLNRFVGTQKIERLFFSYSGAFLEQKA